MRGAVLHANGAHIAQYPQTTWPLNLGAKPARWVPVCLIGAPPSAIRVQQHTLLLATPALYGPDTPLCFSLQALHVASRKRLQKNIALMDVIIKYFQEW